MAVFLSLEKFLFKSLFFFYFGFFLFLSFFFFFFFRRTLSKLKFPGQGSNRCHSSIQSHSSHTTRSITHWATREFQLVFFFFNWSIVDLQCCISFRCTAKWFRYIYIYIFLNFPNTLFFFLLYSYGDPVTHTCILFPFFSFFSHYHAPYIHFWFFPIIDYFKISFYIPDISPLSDTWFPNIFSHSWVVFTFLKNRRFYIFMKFQE